MGFFDSKKSTTTTTNYSDQSNQSSATQGGGVDAAGQINANNLGQGVNFAVNTTSTTTDAGAVSGGLDLGGQALDSVSGIANKSLNLAGDVNSASLNFGRQALTAVVDSAGGTQDTALKLFNSALDAVSTANEQALSAAYDANKQAQSAVSDANLQAQSTVLSATGNALAHTIPTDQKVTTTVIYAVVALGAFMFIALMVKK